MVPLAVSLSHGDLLLHILEGFLYLHQGSGSMTILTVITIDLGNVTMPTTLIIITVMIIVTGIQCRDQ